MNKLRDENYYIIQGWMINRLKLKGTSLQLYAILYGFSQDQSSEFTGSISYLCDWLNVTKNTVLKALNDLQNDGFIIKTEHYLNNIKYCSYKIGKTAASENRQTVKGGAETAPPVQFLTKGGAETAPGVVQFLTKGGAETAPNNKYINNNINNNINIPLPLQPVISNSITDESLTAALADFIAMRKSLKKPLSPRAMELQIKHLFELSETPAEMTAIVNQSVMNSWQSFYPLKDGYKGKAENRFMQPTTDVSEIEKQFIASLDA